MAQIQPDHLKNRGSGPGKICKKLNEGLNEEVDFKMSTIKPITAQWVIDLYAYLLSQPSIIVNGFQAAGLKNYC